MPMMRHITCALPNEQNDISRRLMIATSHEKSTRNLMNHEISFSASQYIYLSFIILLLYLSFFFFFLLLSPFLFLDD